MIKVAGFGILTPDKSDGYFFFKKLSWSHALCCYPFLGSHKTKKNENEKIQKKN